MDAIVSVGGFQETLGLLRNYFSPHPNLPTPPPAAPPLGRGRQGRELVSPLNKGGVRGVNPTFAKGLLFVGIGRSIWIPNS